MRILFIGDIVGRAGRTIIAEKLIHLKDKWHIDVAIVNAENAAAGRGITKKIYHKLRDDGADVITLGNHAWDQKEIFSFIDHEPQLIRPTNFPNGTPGKGATLHKTKNNQDILVINVMGQLFMNPTLDNPFHAMQNEIDTCPLKQQCDAIFIDFHAEATSEKMAAAYHADGHISALIGTHTHVPTADARILPKGTAYQSDVGMCGDYNSIIGMKTDEAVRRYNEKIIWSPLQTANENPTLAATAIETDDKTGLAKHIAPVIISRDIQNMTPHFWKNEYP